MYTGNSKPIAVAICPTFSSCAPSTWRRGYLSSLLFHGDEVKGGTWWFSLAGAASVEMPPLFALYLPAVSRRAARVAPCLRPVRSAARLNAAHSSSSALS